MSEASAHVTDLEYAWAAGFIDGEGCFGLRTSGSNALYATLTVNNTVLAPLIKLQTMFGGSIYTQRPARQGSSTCYAWRLGSRTALVGLCKLLLPHMVVKQEHARLILAYSELVGRRGQPVDPENQKRRMAIYDSLRILNARPGTEYYELTR